MINLIPDNVKASTHYAILNSKLIRYLAVSALTMVAIGLITGASLLRMRQVDENLQGQLNGQNQQITQLKPVEAQGQKLSDQITTIKELLNRQVKFSLVIPNIAKILPPGAVMSNLDFSVDDIVASATVKASAASAGDKPFVVSALVKDQDTAATLLDNINAKKDLFTAADTIDIKRNADSVTATNYPYVTVINAYLKKQALTDTTSKQSYFDAFHKLEIGG